MRCLYLILEVQMAPQLIDRKCQQNYIISLNHSINYNLGRARELIYLDVWNQKKRYIPLIYFFNQDKVDQEKKIEERIERKKQKQEYRSIKD